MVDYDRLAEWCGRAQRAADGRLTVSPLHTFTARIASEVQFQPGDVILAAGLNDATKFSAPMSVAEEEG